MAPAARTLRLYGRPSDAEALDWDDVERSLAAAGTYWVVAATAGHPHPRPVWGVWQDLGLHLSIGSPVLARATTPGTPVTVHLDSGTDVVIVEGAVVGPTADAGLVAAYEARYDWRYDVEAYGPLTTVAPARVLAWRSAGWAGREGFRSAGAWAFDGG